MVYPAFLSYHFLIRPQSDELLRRESKRFPENVSATVEVDCNQLAQQF